MSDAAVRSQRDCRQSFAFLQEAVNQFAGDVFEHPPPNHHSQTQSFPLALKAGRDHLRSPLNVAGVRVKKNVASPRGWRDDG